MDEPVMYVLVNSDIKMSKGKTAAQVAHVCVKAAQMCNSFPAFFGKAYLKWYQGSYTKIILKASGEEIKQIHKRYHEISCITIDEGRTQIRKGTLTALAFIPLCKSEAPTEIKELKLL